FTETATSPYIWNGTEYTETGDYTQNFTSANGCDSIVTLHLNILSGISQDGTAEISVFPTPVTDILNITSSETISEIEIVNVMGQVVKKIEVNSDNAVCSVEDLKAGVYIVRISTASATLSQRKFVKE
ncbi:MAG: T9SS type A sorting domain-containing protein, partial [Bacteroidales bacterium]|nr:T9SS type A sorting domain-containing protein [Bacteroidales bacterium]